MVGYLSVGMCAGVSWLLLIIDCASKSVGFIAIYPSYLKKQGCWLLSATAPALLYLLHPCSRRQLLLGSGFLLRPISYIHIVVGNCSCVALPPASMQSCVALSPASMQSSATAPRLWLPASPYLLYPYSRRQLLLRCSTSCIHAVVRCSISCIHAVVGNCSCVALSPASMQSSLTPIAYYL